MLKKYNISHNSDITEGIKDNRSSKYKNSGNTIDTSFSK